MKIFIALWFMVAALGAQATQSFQAAGAAAPTHPALYSFADVYRLTLSGAATGNQPLMSTGEAAVRVSLSQPAAVPELSYSVVRVNEPQRWLLLLAGLALATWVARRRLGYSS
jgi:hypothetical protein